jgi:hypothetical protein
MYSSDVLICVHVEEYNILYIFICTGKTVLNFLFLVYPGYTCRLQYWFVAPVVFFFSVHCLQVQMCLQVHRSSLLIILVLVNLFLF